MNLLGKRERPRRFVLLKKKYSARVKLHFQSGKYDHIPRDLIESRIERAEFIYLFELERLDHENYANFGNSEPPYYLLKESFEEAWITMKKLIDEYDQTFQASKTRVSAFISALPSFMDDYKKKARVRWNELYLETERENDIDFTSYMIRGLDKELRMCEQDFRGQVLRKLRRTKRRIDSFISIHYNGE